MRKFESHNEENLSEYLSNKLNKNIIETDYSGSSSKYLLPNGNIFSIPDENKLLKIESFDNKKISLLNYIKDHPNLPVAKIYNIGYIDVPKKFLHSNIKNNNRKLIYYTMEKVDTEGVHEVLSYLEEVIVNITGDFFVNGLFILSNYVYNGQLKEIQKIQKEIKSNENYIEDGIYGAFNYVLDIVTTLFKHGIRWDDIHIEQFGFTDRLVAFDIDGITFKYDNNVKNYIKENMNNNIKKFGEYIKEEIEINPEADEIMDDDLEAASDYYDKISQHQNWVVSYTNRRGMDFDLSISAQNLDDLISKVKKDLTPEEYNSIFKIEYGTLEMTKENNLFDPKRIVIREIKEIFSQYESTTSGELALDVSPSLLSTDTEVHLVERYDEEGVDVVVYGGHEYSSILNEYRVSYNKLELDVLEEIRDILVDAKENGYLEKI